MKRTVWEKLGDFVLGKGFYIVLFLCVATIGISGYYLIRSVTDSSGQQLEPASVDQTVELPDESAAAPAVPRQPVETQTAAQAPAVSAEPQEETQQPSTPQAADPQPSTSTPAQKTAVYTWPVKGEVSRGYSLEVLAYDETMGDWRTHSGIDIAAEEGLKVLCISDGTVQAVYQDDLMGATVVVDHGDGLVSAYSNLASDPVVAVGQAVETGTVLGTVGNTAIAERASVSHLHLEMAQDGDPVDPENFLP
jgi:murein DD-endopeptidase MepM/ murein hydrolase activator NlpD